MNKNFYYFLVLSLVLGCISYLVLENIFIALGVMFVTIIYYILFVNKKISLHQKKIKRFHECYHFINTFIISLSIKGSTSQALAAAVMEQDDEFKERINSLTELSDLEVLEYLNKYFIFQIYRLFLETIYLWVDQGGNILHMMENITNQLRINEEFLTFSEHTNVRKMFEMITLWAFSLVILVILRFSLVDFYQYFVTNIIFVIGVVAIMLFVLISVHILLIKMTDIPIKGWKYED